MKSLATLLLLAFAPLAYAQDAKDRPMSPTFKATAPLTVKAGDHIVIDSSSATGEVFFFYDEIAFPKSRATERGKVLILSTPVSGNYTVHVVSLNDKAKETFSIKVTGGNEPPKPPDVPIPPSDGLEALKLEMRAGFLAMDARLKALEGIKPKPPPAKIAAHITFIGAEKTAEARATQNDPNMEAFLTKANIKIHALKTDWPLIKSKGLDIAVEAADGVPCAVLQDKDGKVLGQVRMGTTADVWDYTQKFLAGDK